MLAHCLGIAVGIAAACAQAAYSADLQGSDAMPPIQPCVVESLRVDGLPVVQHGWCYWDRRDRLWLPLAGDIARSRVFGIRPIRD